MGDRKYVARGDGLNGSMGMECRVQDIGDE